jgi:hypothetical protein
VTTDEPLSVSQSAAVIAWARAKRTEGYNTAQINEMLHATGWELTVIDGWDDHLFLIRADDE